MVRRLPVLVLLLSLSLAASAAAAPRDRLDRALRQAVWHGQAGSVPVDVMVSGPTAAALPALRDAGLHVLARSDDGPVRLVSGRIAVASLLSLGAARGVREVHAVADFGLDSTGGEGDAAHRGPAARALAGASDGTGVKVGIISDSVNQKGGGINASKAVGDLPAAGVQVLSEDTSADVRDEGRAMAELVYDIAPGATLLFATGTVGGAAGKAAAIRALADAGANVIVDDIFYMSEPFFQDGVIARAVDEVAARGVAYFASAGNRARQSWEAATPQIDGAGLVDFDPGPGVDTIQTIRSVPDGDTLKVALQWNEPWGGATTNLDVELVAPDGSPLPTTGGSVLTQGTTSASLPYEPAAYLNKTGAAVPVAVRIRRVSGDGTPLLKYIARLDSAGGWSIAEHPTSSPTINPDAAGAAGAFTVGAVASDDPGLDTVRSFTSRGPLTRLRDKGGAPLDVPDVRAKPTLAGADRIANNVPGDTFQPTFSGTSAAAPSAAGVAALVLGARPGLSPAALRALLTSPVNTQVCSEGADACGAGFVFADRAVGQALDVTPPTVVPVLAPSVPDGRNGWYVSELTVVWNVADAGSPLLSRDGCGSVRDLAEGPLTLTCTASSIGGTTAVPLTVRRDSRPPLTPAVTGLPTRSAFYNEGLPATLGCVAADATSGIATCEVSGWSRALGRHTVTAVATDRAGLVSPVFARTYTVRLLPALEVAPLPGSGCRRSVSVALHNSRTKGKVQRVRFSMSGLKRVEVTRVPSRVKLGRFTRKQTTVRVSVRFRSGYTSTFTRVYKRCA